MERVHSMFSNAFTTKAGQLIEKATAANLTSEDWGLNMEICDCITTYEDGPKDAVKAIKKRLTANKNQNQVIYTLTVLETCVKNCGNRFHILVTSKEFCNDVLLKLIQTKNTPSLMLQNKVLGLIQEWAETFKSTAAMKGVVEVYEELKEKGWEFPKKDEAAAAPIITPKRSVPQPQVRPQMQMQPMFMPMMPGAAPIQVQPPQRIPPGARPSTGPITPSQEQITKLRSELQIVLSNVQVMSEMLTELIPGQTEASDLELLQELNRTCRAMQQRVVELVERVANEELTVELLKVNDDLNNVFLRYERFERYRMSESAQTEATNPMPATMQAQAPYPPPGSVPYAPPGASPYPAPQHTEPPPSYSDTEAPTPEVNDLIDLGGGDSSAQAAAAAAAPVPTLQPEVPAATNDLAGLSLDQLMMTPSQPASYPTLSQDLAQFDGSISEPSTLEMSKTETEIEQWLQSGESKNVTQNQGAVANGATASENTIETTDEFNAFLSERAAAGDQMPSLPDVPTGAIGESNGADTRQRKMQTGNQPMFGL